MKRWETPKGRWMPNPRAIVTLPYGIRNDRYAAGFHTGVDLAVPGRQNQKVVWALPHRGWVYAVSRDKAYGLYMIVSSKSGHQYLFAHLSEPFMVAGESVENGQTIGLTGVSGNATGDHVHIEKSRSRLWEYGDTLPPELFAYGTGK